MYRIYNKYKVNNINTRIHFTCLFSILYYILIHNYYNSSNTLLNFAAWYWAKKPKPTLTMV